MNRLLQACFYTFFSCIIGNTCFAQYGEYEQSGTFGIKLGTVYSKITLDDRASQAIQGEDEFGLRVGAFYRLQVNNFYFQPGLDYTALTNKLVLLDFMGTPSYPATREDENLDLKFRTWDIPFMVGGKWNSFRFVVGPVFSLLGKAQGTFMGDETDVKNEFRKTTLAVKMGVGYDFGNLAIDFKYERSLSKIGESIYLLLGEEYALRSRGFNLSVSYLFKKKSL